MQSILLVEDSKEVQALVRSLMGGHHFHCAGTLAAAKGLLLERSFDLMLLDVNLPDGNGFEFLAAMQDQLEAQGCAVIFLTARGETSEKVMGLTLGAEDYVTKPFDMLELQARIQTKLKRKRVESDSKSQLKKGDLRLDLPTQQLFQCKEGQEFHTELTPLEFQLLHFLLSHEDQLFTREQLLKNVWGDSVFVLDRTVDSHIKSLRKKIENSAFAIKSVYGSGYKLEKKAVTLRKSA